MSAASPAHTINLGIQSQWASIVKYYITFACARAHNSFLRHSQAPCLKTTYKQVQLCTHVGCTKGVAFAMGYKTTATYM